MHTFYVPASQINDTTLRITGPEHHHLRNVVRAQPGETVRIIDGAGNVYITCLLERGDAQASSTTGILHHEYRAADTPRVTLFQGLPKNDKMALILQKTTELGVTEIVPMRSAYALQRPSQNRLERWERVLIAATKQSERAWLPLLQRPQTFSDALTEGRKFSLCLFLHPPRDAETTGEPLRNILRTAPRPDAVALFVGPEGGFADAEVTSAVASGCRLATFGGSILRTETAAIAAVAAVVYEFRA